MHHLYFLIIHISVVTLGCNNMSRIEVVCKTPGSTWSVRSISSYMQGCFICSVQHCIKIWFWNFK